MATEMYALLERGEKISLVVDTNATEYRPFILKETILYDPEDDFRPVDDEGYSLNKVFRDEAEKLIAKGKKKWTAPAAANNAPESIPAPAAGPAPASPASSLEMLIAESVAKIASERVVTEARPFIDKFIRETYGSLPSVIEVKTPKKTHKITGIVHEKFETVLNLVNCDVPVFLTGPAGCGKNVLCKQVADSLGYEFYFSNAVTQEYKLTGFIDANGHYHETQFYKAFTGGGVFMLDEIDASTPEVLVILNAAIANRYFDFPTGRVEAHEDFRVVAAGNTYGTGADIEYTGRYQLDAASLDRFAIVEIDYSEAIEDAIASGNKELVRFIREFRKAVRGAKIKFIVSYRSIERLNKIEGIFGRIEAIKIALLRGMEQDDVRTVAMSMNSADSYTNDLKRMVA